MRLVSISDLLIINLDHLVEAEWEDAHGHCLRLTMSPSWEASEGQPAGPHFTLLYEEEAQAMWNHLLSLSTPLPIPTQQ